LSLLDALRGLLQGLLGLLAIALLKRLRRVRKILRDLWVTLLELLGLLAQIRRRLLTLLGCHLIELLGQLIELLGSLIQAWALARLLARESLKVARHLLKRGAAGIGIRVDALLELRFNRRKVGQRLLATARILAQFAFEVGQLRIKRGALLRRERLLLRQLLAQLRGLVGGLLKRLLDSGALFEHALLRVR